MSHDYLDALTPPVLNVYCVQAPKTRHYLKAVSAEAAITRIRLDYSEEDAKLLTVTLHTTGEPL